MSIARKVFTRPDYFIAYGFGSGLAPRAPGTAGSALGLILFIPAVMLLPVLTQLVLIVIALAIGIYISTRVAADLGVKDPSGIVWDEFVGMWIALLWLPAGWIWYVVAFALFRLFDIAKPWPVNLVDEKLGGGSGIMLDDVVAGLYALAGTQLIALLLSEYV